MDRPPPRWLPFVVLGIGLMAISFGAILARLAQGHGLPSLAIAALRLGLAALIAVLVALRVWPAHDPDVIEHEHADLPAGHEHLHDGTPAANGLRHAHPYVVDDQHPRWPGPGG